MTPLRMRLTHGPDFDAQVEHILSGVEAALLAYFTAAKGGRALPTDTGVMVQSCTALLNLGQKYQECNYLEHAVQHSQK